MFIWEFIELAAIRIGKEMYFLKIIRKNNVIILMWLYPAWVIFTFLICIEIIVMLQMSLKNYITASKQISKQKHL